MRGKPSYFFFAMRLLLIPIDVYNQKVVRYITDHVISFTYLIIGDDIRKYIWEFCSKLGNSNWVVDYGG